MYQDSVICAKTVILGSFTIQVFQFAKGHLYVNQKLIHMSSTGLRTQWPIQFTDINGLISSNVYVQPLNL